MAERRSDSDSDSGREETPTTSSGIGVSFYGSSRSQTKTRSKWLPVEREESASDVEGYDSDKDPEYVMEKGHSDNDDDDDDNGDGDANIPARKRQRNEPEVQQENIIESGEGESVEEDVTSSTATTSACGSRDDAEAGPSVRPKKVGRKSELKESAWIQNISKKKRNLGQEYVSVKTKKVMPARKVGPPCNDGCFPKVGLEKIEEIHKQFWEIGDYNRQNEYLIRCLTEEPFKRKYTKKDDSKRPTRLVYSVTHSGRSYVVCREAFMHIFDIKRGKLDFIIKRKREARAATGVVSPDQRGKAEPRNKIIGAQLETMHEFIRDLPVVSSHYTRAKAPLRQYLPAGGSVSGVYCEYQLWMRINHSELTPVKEKFFRKVFTKKYNIAFAPPKVDECNLCCTLDVKISTETDEVKIAELQEKKQQHLDEAKVAQELLKDPMNTAPDSDEFRAIAIDLQQQQPCPKMPVNKSYYTSKLWFLNFCIYDITKNKGHMFVWDETIAKRGPNEISSCILRWLDFVRNTQGDNVTRLRIFADNCAGQNKNIYNVLTLLQQVQKRLLRRVEVIFLVSGHSFMPCDRAFGVIEKVYRSNGYICSVPRYIELLSKSCRKNSYEVFVMKREHFFDVKALEKFVTNRAAGHISKAKQFVIKDSEKEGFYIKNHYSFLDDPREMIHIDLRKGRQSVKGKGRGRPKEILMANIPLAFKYPTERMLKKKKVQSMETVIHMIPETEEREWFSQLIARQKAMHATGPTPADQDSDEEIEEDPDNPSNTLLMDATVLFEQHAEDSSE